MEKAHKVKKKGHLAQLILNKKGLKKSHIVLTTSNILAEGDSALLLAYFFIFVCLRKDADEVSRLIPLLLIVFVNEKLLQRRAYYLFL